MGRERSESRSVHVAGYEWFGVSNNRNNINVKQEQEAPLPLSLSLLPCQSVVTPSYDPGESVFGLLLSLENSTIILSLHEKKLKKEKTKTISFLSYLFPFVSLRFFSLSRISPPQPLLHALNLHIPPQLFSLNPAI